MSKTKNTGSQESQLIMGFRSDNEGNVQGAAIIDYVQKVAAIVLIPIGSPVLPMGA